MGLAKKAFAATTAWILASTAAFAQPAHRSRTDRTARDNAIVYMTSFMRDRLGDLTILDVGNEMRRNQRGNVDPLIIASQRDMETALQQEAAARGITIAPADFFARIQTHVNSNYREEDGIADLGLAVFTRFLNNAGIGEREFNRRYGRQRTFSESHNQLRLWLTMKILENRSQAFRSFDLITLAENRLCLPYDATQVQLPQAARDYMTMHWRDVILEEMIHTRPSATGGPREEVIAAGLRYDLTARQYGQQAIDYTRLTLAEIAIDRLTIGYFAMNRNSESGIAFDSHPYSAFIDVVDNRVVPEPYLNIRSVTDLDRLDRSIFTDAQRGQAIANASARDLLRNLDATLRATHPERAEVFSQMDYRMRQYVAADLLLAANVVTDVFALELLREYKEAYAMLYEGDYPAAQTLAAEMTQIMANSPALPDAPPSPVTPVRQAQITAEINSILRSGQAPVGVPNRYVELPVQACGGAGPQPT
ncbi:MAG: hypothetical protein GC136_08150 [Alphaproteobacteria bacterium]|nr:hypothetical protein [Alphaproteobacteria bacterium]